MALARLLVACVVCVERSLRNAGIHRDFKPFWRRTGSRTPIALSLLHAHAGRAIDAHCACGLGVARYEKRGWGGLRRHYTFRAALRSDIRNSIRWTPRLEAGSVRVGACMVGEPSA